MMLVSACVLIRTEHGKFDEVFGAINKIKGIQRAFPVLGRYDVVADIESKDPSELASAILRIGRITGVVFTETLVSIEQ